MTSQSFQNGKTSGQFFERLYVKANRPPASKISFSSPHKDLRPLDFPSADLELSALTFKSTLSSLYFFTSFWL